MKKLVSLLLLTLLILGVSVASIADPVKITPEDYSYEVDFYLDLVKEYTSKHPKSTSNEINLMLNKAFNVYQPIFDSRQNMRLLSYSDYIPVVSSELNPDEKVIFNSDPYSGLLVLKSASDAIKYSEARYSSGLHNGNGDAFRHALWNTLGSAHAGTTYMKKFADAHETGASNPVSLETTMDYYNNSKGRSFYTSNSSTIGSHLITGFPSRIADMVQNELIRSGNCRRFSGSNFNGTTLISTDSLGEN